MAQYQYIDLRGLFLAVDGNGAGRETLHRGGIERFDAVVDSDDVPIRRVARKAHRVLLAEGPLGKSSKDNISHRVGLTRQEEVVDEKS
jgi:hypothetical protein